VRACGTDLSQIGAAHRLRCISQALHSCRLASRSGAASDSRFVRVATFSSACCSAAPASSTAATPAARGTRGVECRSLCGRDPIATGSREPAQTAGAGAQGRPGPAVAQHNGLLLGAYRWRPGGGRFCLPCRPGTNTRTHCMRWLPAAPPRQQAHLAPPRCSSWWVLRRPAGCPSSEPGVRSPTKYRGEIHLACVVCGKIISFGRNHAFS